MEAYYKVLGNNGRAGNGGTGVWPLPHDGHPGAWLAVEPPLRPCAHGLHLCRRADLIHWLGPTIWRAEIDSGAERVECDDKVVVSRARLISRVTTWTDRTARLFAADCADHALSRERAAGREPDDRSWAAIQAARDYAEGRITEAAVAATRGAAGAAAREAAVAAAWGAAGAAAWGAAGAAAWVAAREAAGEAAWEAAREAAWRRERAWQTDRLFTAYLLTEAA